MIVSRTGEPVTPGQAGELLTRGPYTPRGYFAAPEYNQRAFTAGWYRTGDVVRQDPGGNLIVEGRSKDLINMGGEKVSAEEVEALLRRLPQVAEAAAVPVFDPEKGETVGACVVLHPGTALALDEVRAEFARRGVAAFKTPRHLDTVPALPLTAVGKVDKPALRRAMEAAHKKGNGMDLTLSGVHHIAYVTDRPGKTLTFYRDIIGLPLVHTVSATGWISDGFPDFIHFFFNLGKGTHLAFFYFFGTAPPAAPPELERRARHIAFDVQTEEQMHMWRDRLKAHGVPVTRPLAHELVESIYFDDPNGIQLEICRSLRPFGPTDARDAELTLDALLATLESGDPSLRAVWRAKAGALQTRLAGRNR
jgi:catechol 2,3-dioxygenase-like lactoylglutathione lyase family enzyme